MPILDPWVNQNGNMTTNTINIFETHLLSIRAECQLDCFSFSSFLLGATSFSGISYPSHIVFIS